MTRRNFLKLLGITAVVSTGLFSKETTKLIRERMGTRVQFEGYNIRSVTRVGVGQYNIVFKEPINNALYQISPTKTHFGCANNVKPESVTVNGKQTIVYCSENKVAAWCNFKGVDDELV